jgi:hypothetical protein
MTLNSTFKQTRCSPLNSALYGMTTSSLLETINAVPWATFPQPEWNDGSSVPKALAKVLEANDAKSCSAAYDSLLYAVGNNHAGTYYPVLLTVMPFLGAILEHGEIWPQKVVLCVLDDLFASFQPEAGYENSEEGIDEVEKAFKQAVRTLLPLLEKISKGEGTNSNLARELHNLVLSDAV